MPSIQTIKPNTQKALLLARRQLSELVCDAVNLEGINFTLSEVQTLLDGVTVGGRKLSDQMIALNQSKAWQYIFDSIKAGTFELSKTYACHCHAIAGYEEALEWGQFRTGSVTIAGTTYQPPKASDLDGVWKSMVEQINQIESTYEQAITLFLQMSRNQFFYDVNKRMGRFMMNALLLSKGYPVINLPAKRQLEFNQLMITFYDSNNMQPMIDFLLSCLPLNVVEIMSE